MYVNELGETVLDSLVQNIPTLSINDKEGNPTETPALDMLTTLDEQDNIVIAAVNKDPIQKHPIIPQFVDERKPSRYSIRTLQGKNPDSYNDIDRTEVLPHSLDIQDYHMGDEILLPPHSINILRFS
jgi:alpha-L-arabinofuranosidase